MPRATHRDHVVSTTLSGPNVRGTAQRCPRTGHVSSRTRSGRAVAHYLATPQGGGLSIINLGSLTMDAFTLVDAGN